MICYKDTTFCADDMRCATKDCFRRLTDDDMAALKERWMPVARANFAVWCEAYTPHTNANTKALHE